MKKQIQILALALLAPSMAVESTAITPAQQIEQSKNVLDFGQIKVSWPYNNEKPNIKSALENKQYETVTIPTMQKEGTLYPEDIEDLLVTAKVKIGTLRIHGPVTPTTLEIINKICEGSLNVQKLDLYDVENLAYHLGMGDPIAHGITIDQTEKGAAEHCVDKVMKKSKLEEFTIRFKYDPDNLTIRRNRLDYPPTFDKN